jgi:predicted ATP-dependent serine protease
MLEPIKVRDVPPEKVQWLWRERIPKGMLTVIAGRPDQGKGLCVASIAAEVSRQGINVLYSASEDSNALMTSPRLQAAGADPDRISLWRFQLPLQMRELTEHVRTKNIGLIVMDPFASHLGGGVSRHSDTVRLVTDPLAEMLDETGCSAQQQPSG